VADGKFYERISSYETASIKGTSVVDKTVKVKALVPKSEDPAYNSAADPDKGDFKEYQNAFARSCKKVLGLVQYADGVSVCNHSDYSVGGGGLRITAGAVLKREKGVF